MNEQELLIICKGYKMIVDKMLSTGKCYKFNESIRFVNLKYKLEEILSNNIATEEDYAYVTIKLLGSETYYQEMLRIGKADKRELLMMKVEMQLRDEDCKVIKAYGKDNKVSILFKRNNEGKWISYKSIN